jgi:fructan beta-fructosidase
MHWGHAVSRDLVHWQELDEALYPDKMGTMFSGSAVVDENNTAGFQKGSEKTLIALYTAAGNDSALSKGQRFTQCLAYSNDRARTWTKYEKNPVLPHIAADNRDPKVIWYAPENKWVMALYLDKNDFALFDSKDLKSWNELQRITIPGSIECPEFFEIAVEGKPTEKRWVLYGANGLHLIGNFDGKKFTPETKPLALNFGNCFYASQTYNLSKKDSRRILIPWGQINIPGMPFNQMMGVPIELKLKSVGANLRLSAEPIRELQKLRHASAGIQNETITSGNSYTARHNSDLWESVLELSPEKNAEVRLDIRGALITYDSAKQELSCLGKKAPLPLIDGKIKLHLLVDRTSIDIFGNDGDLYMPMGFIPKNDNFAMIVSAQNAAAKIVSLKNWKLDSAWKK